MSFKATNWAIRQRGLDPAAKLLLWQLADRHNADTRRCDPSQELLAYDLEMSRSTVNRKLRELEERGFIKRVPRIDPRTGQQLRTFYLLAFDSDFEEHEDANAVCQADTRAVCQNEQEPCVKSDEIRVSNWDTNPVREPGREPVGAETSRRSPPPNVVHPPNGFAEFWNAYPNAKKRRHAERAFAEAVRNGADPGTLIAAAKAFAAENEGRPRQYLPFPERWLRDERWTEYPDAQPASASDAEGKRKALIEKGLQSRSPTVRENAERLARQHGFTDLLQAPDQSEGLRYAAE